MPTDASVPPASHSDDNLPWISGGRDLAYPGRTLTRHYISRDAFKALAVAEDDREAVWTLRGAERSLRLLMLRVLVDGAAERPEATGPLPGVEDAWLLLAAAYREAPADVERLLIQPQTGFWVARTLRRMRGSLSDTTPLWVDVGYLHALAATAAVSAGLDFHISIPSRGGFAVLPALGCARLPDRASFGSVAVRAVGGRVELAAHGMTIAVPADRTSDAPGWHGLRVLHAEASGQALTVSFDDLDPYRTLRSPAPPERIPPATFDRWQQLFQDAWTELTGDHQALVAAMPAGLFSITPLSHTERFRPRSASTGDAFGAALASEPDDAVQFAATLVHEFQHIKLGGLLHLTQIYEDGGQERFYAPWRDDPRPLGGLLQGVYAFVGITAFWRTRTRCADGCAADLARFEFALWRREVWQTLETLRVCPAFTAPGRQLVADLAATVAPWLDDFVSPRIARLAGNAVLDHRAGWRIRHLRPSPGIVTITSRAWLDGSPAPTAAMQAADATIRPDPTARWLDTRAVLARIRLGDPSAFAELCLHPQDVGRRVSGATAADLAYTTGDFQRARQMYLAELADDPDHTSAWTGLGAAEAALTPGPAASVLLHRPEIVRAVQQSLISSAGRPAPPLQLAAWLGEHGVLVD